jgi:hypothetical protein
MPALPGAVSDSLIRVLLKRTRIGRQVDNRKAKGERGVIRQTSDSSTFKREAGAKGWTRTYHILRKKEMNEAQP